VRTETGYHCSNKVSIRLQEFPRWIFLFHCRLLTSSANQRKNAWERVPGKIQTWYPSKISVQISIVWLKARIGQITCPNSRHDGVRLHTIVWCGHFEAVAKNIPHSVSRQDTHESQCEKSTEHISLKYTLLKDHTAQIVDLDNVIRISRTRV